MTGTGVFVRISSPSSKVAILTNNLLCVATYNESGAVDYLGIFDNSSDQYNTLTVASGARVQKQLVDITARAGYSLIGAKPKTPAEMACEYYQFDWEYAQTPEESSMIASSWVCIPPSVLWRL